METPAIKTEEDYGLWITKENYERWVEKKLNENVKYWSPEELEQRRREKCEMQRQYYQAFKLRADMDAYRRENAKNAKRYYHDNQEKVKRYKAETHLCECGGTYTYNNIYRHKKTYKHLDYLEEIKVCDKNENTI